MPAECMCCGLAPTWKEHFGSGAASFPVPPYFDTVARGGGAGVLVLGFFFFLICINRKEGGVICETHCPTHTHYYGLPQR